MPRRLREQPRPDTGKLSEKWQMPTSPRAQYLYSTNVSRRVTHKKIFIHFCHQRPLEPQSQQVGLERYPSVGLQGLQGHLVFLNRAVLAGLEASAGLFMVPVKG